MTSTFREVVLRRFEEMRTIHKANRTKTKTFCVGDYLPTQKALEALKDDELAGITMNVATAGVLRVVAERISVGKGFDLLTFKRGARSPREIIPGVDRHLIEVANEVSKMPRVLKKLGLQAPALPKKENEESWKKFYQDIQNEPNLIKVVQERRQKAAEEAAAKRAQFEEVMKAEPEKEPEKEDLDEDLDEDEDEDEDEEDEDDEDEDENN